MYFYKEKHLKTDSKLKKPSKRPSKRPSKILQQLEGQGRKYLISKTDTTNTKQKLYNMNCYLA